MFKVSYPTIQFYNVEANKRVYMNIYIYVHMSVFKLRYNAIQQFNCVEANKDDYICINEWHFILKCFPSYELGAYLL